MRLLKQVQKRNQSTVCSPLWEDPGQSARALPSAASHIHASSIRASGSRNPGASAVSIPGETARPLYACYAGAGH
jgi:hypothetical protein